MYLDIENRRERTQSELFYSQKRFSIQNSTIMCDLYGFGRKKGSALSSLFPNIKGMNSDMKSGNRMGNLINAARQCRH